MSVFVRVYGIGALTEEAPSLQLYFTADICWKSVTSVRKAFQEGSKRVQKILLVIKYCQSLVFCQVFGREFELKAKLTVTVIHQRRKNRQNAKENHLFLAFLPSINLSSLPGRLVEKPLKRS